MRLVGCGQSNCLVVAGDAGDVDMDGCLAKPD